MDRMEHINRFIEKQRGEARGMRREMLDRNLHGTRLLLSNLLLPVLKSLEGIELEYEITSQTGVKLYADAFHKPMRHVYECEGYVPHVELITRERHDFEQSRIRTFASKKLIYIPFSRDELEKKPEACRRSLYEIIGDQATPLGRSQFQSLHVVERELLRFALRLAKAFTISDACDYLNLGQTSVRKHLRGLMAKRLIESVGKGTERYHYYQITKEGSDCFLT
ncbi:hypothetical protein [Cohnella sp. JJ-181]|uniref:hypothetical protein n=1 Tax=Cohnella rhizoplanae TaxID=2974897 RepID=UPI0022FF6CED|nr:hypothetical protein [Cohnella sp. JJ-181]CAI6080497.1 hypothetical protein COHCIP112018_03004 [Cohnella sp. JJ-181]